jgi:hypothetical protein
MHPESLHGAPDSRRPAPRRLTSILAHGSDPRPKRSGESPAALDAPHHAPRQHDRNPELPHQLRRAKRRPARPLGAFDERDVTSPSPSGGRGGREARAAHTAAPSRRACSATLPDCSRGKGPLTGHAAPRDVGGGGSPGEPLASRNGLGLRRRRPVLEGSAPGCAAEDAGRSPPRRHPPRERILIGRLPIALLGVGELFEMDSEHFLFEAFQSRRRDLHGVRDGIIGSFECATGEAGSLGLNRMRSRFRPVSVE